jgi:FAD dependent oxidoreductase TIGR03364
VSERFDLAVVGAGIVGLATALAAVRRKLRVVVIDRDAQANGASVRNFGFATVSRQERGAMWGRTRRSREVWFEIAASAGVPIVHTGLWLTARRPESVRILEAFMATEMAAGCTLLSPAEARQRCPNLVAPDTAAVLQSTIEIRVESRDAIPRLADWLANTHGVTFLRNTVVRGIDVPNVHTSRGKIQADRIAACPGDDFNSLYPELIGGYSLTRCKLQMLRLADPGFKLPGTLMSDLGLARYLGYTNFKVASGLRARLRQEQPRHLKHGVNLLVVQSGDGTLIVGDSHHYAKTPDPFRSAEVDSLLLEEFRSALGLEPPPVIERWMGTYACAEDRAILIHTPAASVRLAIVTCGAGVSLGFAIGEELVESLFGS